MNRSRLLIALSLVAFAGAAHAGQGPPADDPLRALLGADYTGAKILALSGPRGKSVVTIDIPTRTVKTLASFDTDERRIVLSRPYWSPDARKVIFSYDGKCYVINADGTNRHQILADVPNVREAGFWADPATGELCVVYCRPFTDSKGQEAGETCLFRPAARTRTTLADQEFDAGLSRDGTHLGGAGGGVRMKNLATGDTRRLNVENSACNASMSPDNTYRIMHLYAPHLFFGIRDEFDHELWVMQGPDRGNWETPRWSNHPDFCTVLLRGVEVVKISTKEAVKLTGMRVGCSVPQLWLPSAAGKTPARAGPIDHLKLAKLASYKKKLALAQDYSPIIAELSRSAEPEAKTIVAELEKQGEGKLVRALAEQDPLKFVPDVRELAARFKTHPIGVQAARILDSPEFKREIDAGKALYGLWRYVWFLNPIDGAQPLFTDPVFFERNRGTLSQMVELIAPARKRLQGTKGLPLMEAMAKQFALPDRTTEPGNKTIMAIVITSKVSHVPSLQEIAPYKDALTYTLCIVVDVVNGEYDKRQIVVAHYVIKDKKETDAAKWKPGVKQLITVDRLDAHPKLLELPAADEANDLKLVPYWGLKVMNSW